MLYARAKNAAPRYILIDEQRVPAHNDKPRNVINTLYAIFPFMREVLLSVLKSTRESRVGERFSETADRFALMLLSQGNYSFCIR